MIKIIEQEPSKHENIIEMRDMEPLQVGEVCDNGEIVMRTASNSVFEVISLSNPGLNSCWSCRNNRKVRLFNPGESVTIRVSND